MRHMAIVSVHTLAKSFRVSASEPGFANALRHFFKRKYRLVEAVKPLSFDIEAGEIVGFLGPNGAGKTTTLKMLSGFLHPSGGHGGGGGPCAVSAAEGVFESRSRW